VRNSKIRRRIAAGKLRLRIRDLRNLGPRSEAMLESVGIASVEALRQRGALEAYLMLRRAGVTRSLNALWALAGALEPWPEGTAWQEVAGGDERLPLLMAVEAREKARREVMDALSESPAPARRRMERRQGGAFEAEAWAPGLPFPADSGKSPPQKRKNRR
jgi:DNA transformation protein